MKLDVRLKKIRNCIVLKDAITKNFVANEHHCFTFVFTFSVVVVDLATDRLQPGGVRHDPQRFMGKTVTVPHFNRDTVEFASRKRNESNPGIKTLLPFPKIITEESDFENF